MIERRYIKGVKNFTKYVIEADDWYIYDNSGIEYILVAKGFAGRQDIFNFEVYNKLKPDE